MIISAHEFPSSVIQTDVAIIGGGASGLTLASGLNRDTIVIEGGGMNAEPERDTHFTFETTGLPMNNYSLRRRLVGGAAAHWSGRCAPLDPADLIAKPWANHAGWLVSHDEIEPFLTQALNLLNLPSVSTALGRHAVRTGALPEFEAGLEPQIWQFVRSERHRGLHLGRHFIENFTQDGKVLLTQSDAVRLVSDGKKLTSVVCRDRSGREIIVRANEFVFACGCIEASRLLLQNHNDCAELIGPVERWLGRGFHQHLLIDAGTVTASLSSALKLQKHFNNFRWRSGEGYEFGARLTEDAITGDGLLAGSACIVYRPQGEIDLINGASKIFSIARGRENLYLNPKINVELSIEQRIDFDSRISLSRNIDINGQRTPTVHWNVNEIELRTARKVSELFSKTLARSGLGRFEPPEDDEAVMSRPTRDSLHHLGGTQMSADASGGVVDRDLTVHGSHNLSIVGGSVFPSGGHVNPTLTIMALALRLAERLNSKRG